MSRSAAVALLALAGGLFLAFIGADLGRAVWLFCHPDQSAANLFPPGFKAEPRSCFDSAGLAFSAPLWLLYSACTSACLGAAALVSSWLLYRKRRAGRTLWIAICALATLYFMVFWGWRNVGVYAYPVALVLSILVIPKSAETREVNTSAAGS